MGSGGRRGAAQRVVGRTTPPRRRHDAPVQLYPPPHPLCVFACTWANAGAGLPVPASSCSMAAALALPAGKARVSRESWKTTSCSAGAGTDRERARSGSLDRKAGVHIASVPLAPQQACQLAASAGQHAHTSTAPLPAVNAAMSRPCRPPRHPRFLARRIRGRGSAAAAPRGPPAPAAPAPPPQCSRSGGLAGCNRRQEGGRRIGAAGHGWVKGVPASTASPQPPYNPQLTVVPLGPAAVPGVIVRQRRHSRHQRRRASHGRGQQQQRCSQQRCLR